MAELVAVGKNHQQRSWRLLPEEETILLGRAPRHGLSVPWDPLISREHAHLRLTNGMLTVSELATARNPILFSGQPTKQFVLESPGEFVIGETRFRFDAGEAASYFNLSAFRAGLDLLVDVSVANAEAHHRRLQDAAVAALADSPLAPVTNLDARHRSPMLMFEGRHGLDLARLQSDLAARHITVSLRAGRLRLSPGIWNDASDVEAFTVAVRASVENVAR